MTALVLMYHRVTDSAPDPFGLVVDPKRFLSHIEQLPSLGEIVPLTEVLNPSPTPKIAITFDDGYADNATTALPALAAADMPCTLFVATERLGGHRFWWDVLAEGLIGDHPLPASIDLEVGGRPLWLDLSGPAARRTAMHLLHRRLLPMSPPEINSQLEYVLAALGAPPPRFDTLTMSVEQLHALAALWGVEIGAHTRTHARLAMQTAAVQREEVVGSIADLAALLETRVRSFAYPFGGPGTVGKLAPRLVREAGCDLACTTSEGAVPGRPNPYRIPRLNVLNWDAEEFSYRVARLLDGP